MENAKYVLVLSESMERFRRCDYSSLVSGDVNETYIKGSIFTVRKGNITTVYHVVTELMDKHKVAGLYFHDMIYLSGYFTEDKLAYFESKVRLLEF